MPEMDKLFCRLAEKFAEHDISVDRITWLSGVGVEDNGARDYLKDDVLSKNKEALKKIFGDTIGHYLNEILGDEGGEGVECAVDELLLLDGWIVQVSYREPNPKTVKIVNGDRVSSWTPSSWITTTFIYSGSLSTALCKALLWGHRLKRHAFAEARRLQAVEAHPETMGLRGIRLAYGNAEHVSE